MVKSCPGDNVREALEGRTTLVTGASKGIGRAVALGLADAGADVVITARSRSALKVVEKEVRERGRSCHLVVADVSDVAGIASLVEEAWGWRDGVDVLVNVAGVIVRRDHPHVQPEDWSAVFDTNARAPFFLMQDVGTRMTRAGRGVIINITSIAASSVTRAPITYQASKAALVQLTRAFAERLAPAVRVNAVAPGYVRTDLNERWLEVGENRSYVENRTPMRRLGEPDDVVGAVVFLASSEASFVTGQQLVVDGGWTVS